MRTKTLFIYTLIAISGLVGCEAKPTKKNSETVDLASPGKGNDAMAKIIAAPVPDTNEPDLANGRRQFTKCKVCHTLKKGESHKVGPNLYHILGRKAASMEGFRYSKALADSGLMWNEGTLDQWVKNPHQFVPGSRMSFLGIRDDKARKDVLAYVLKETTMEKAEKN